MTELARLNALAVIILAAGKGTRMKNQEMAKVMNEIDGRPMVEYVVDLAVKLQAQRTFLIVGWQKQSIIDHLSGRYPHLEFIEQLEQLGTDHAVLQTADA